jgi:alkylation response protein AidB-like acyl-CoA dehydrogenase
MALALTEEHLDLAGSVRGWAARAAPREVVRPVLEAEDHGAALYRDALRPGLAAQGLLGLHLAESLGGHGFGLPELAVAVEELGQALLPGGFLPTVLASALLNSAALSGPSPARAAESAGSPAAGALEGLVKSLANGAQTGAAGLVPGLRAAPGAQPGDLVVDGACGPVLGAALADLLILPVSHDGGQAWVAVDAADVEITPLDSLDLTRPAGRVSADRLAVPAERVLSGLSPGLPRTLAAILLAAEACGIADWAVTTAADYAKVRQQFGRPIGQFQAVKHRCAWMLTRAEQAAAAVWDAARAGQEGERPEREFAASVAAVVAIDAAVACAHECIQVLGGIGYTWEHDAHLYYRRALSLRALLGDAGDWAAEAARLALAGARRPASVDLPAEAAPVRASVRAELAAIAAIDPAHHAKRLADAGWVTPHLPRPWGRDASPLEQVVIAEELRSAGLKPASLIIGAWVVPALVQYGTPEQQQRFLPATLRGETVWCQLFSEPGAGSDLAGLSTRAERAEGGWRLTGQKVWTSLAAHASWAICVARTDPGAPKHDGITYFLVDMASPGITVRPLRELTGDALFNEVFLDGVFVPDDLVVGEVNNGWRVARTTLANERVSLSQSWTFGCGVPELLDTLRDLGEAPGPAVLARAGRLICEGHAIDLLGVRVTLKQLSGTEPGATGSVRKLLGMRLAQRIAEECWTLTGTDGALGDTRWSRPVLFTRALTIGGGTTDIQLNIIGERILGLPRDPDPQIGDFGGQM